MNLVTVIDKLLERKRLIMQCCCYDMVCITVMQYGIGYKIYMD